MLSSMRTTRGRTLRSTFRNRLHGRIRPTPSGSMRFAVSSITAFSWGWVTRHQVDEIAGRNGAGEGRDEVKINLRLVLGEVGIVVDEAVGESTTGQLWRDWQDEPPNEDGHSGIIDEAVAFLEASGVLENPLNCYWRDIRRLEAESSRRLRASGPPPGSRGHMNTR